MAKLVSKTYGDALFEVATEDGKPDIFLEEVEAVLGILKTNEEYISLLNHPKISVEEKVSMIEAAFKGKVSDELVGFLVTVIEKGRFGEVENILEYFVERVWQTKKIGVACVTSAAELTEAQKNKIKEKLLATTDYVEFRISYDVDKSLIGGMVIRIGGRVVDSSVKTKLERMARDLTKIQLTN